MATPKKSYIVNSLPASPEASTVYYVKSGNKFELYVTDKNGTAVELNLSSIVGTLNDVATNGDYSTVPIRVKDKIIAQHSNVVTGNGLKFVFDNTKEDSGEIYLLDTYDNVLTKLEMYVPNGDGEGAKFSTRVAGKDAILKNQFTTLRQLHEQANNFASEIRKYESVNMGDLDPLNNGQYVFKRNKTHVFVGNLDNNQLAVPLNFPTSISQNGVVVRVIQMNKNNSISQGLTLHPGAQNCNLIHDTVQWSTTIVKEDFEAYFFNGDWYLTLYNEKEEVKTTDTIQNKGSVSSTEAVDYTQGKVVYCTMASDTDFYFAPTPVGESVVIEMIIDGNFTPTMKLDLVLNPSTVVRITKLEGSANYDGSGRNHFTISLHHLKDASNNDIYDMFYTIQNV